MLLRPKLVKAALGLAVCVAGGASSLAASCSGPEALQTRLAAHPEAQTYAELGNWFEQKGQSVCAAESYRAALKIDPRFRPALDRLGKSLLAAGDYSGAIALLRSAPRDEDLTLDLATAYGNAGMAEDASETLVRAVKANPASAKLTSALVVLLAANNQLDDAYRLADQFYKLHPHDLDGEKLYLRVLVATNQAPARPLARKLLAEHPHDGELLYLNAVLEQKAGEFAAARDHFQQAITLAPDYAEARYNLGLVLARLQDPAGAKAQLEKAIGLGATEPEAHLELSKVLRTLGEDGQADAQLKLYQQAMKANTDRAMAASKSSDAEKALEKGDTGRAEALYREALEATPQDASLEYKLALALDREGDSNAERSALQRAVQIDPNLAVAQHQLGYLFYKGGEYDDAEEHFRRAVRADPGFTQAWISLAATLATKSRFSEAQEAVAHALRLDPRNAEALQMKRELPVSHSAY
jgi:tetratricopeptide (TPR) repeat protein